MPNMYQVAVYLRRLRVLCEWQHATIIWILEQWQFRINFLNFSETTLKNLY